MLQFRTGRSCCWPRPHQWRSVPHISSYTFRNSAVRASCQGDAVFCAGASSVGHAASPSHACGRARRMSPAKVCATDMTFGRCVALWQVATKAVNLPWPFGSHDSQRPLPGRYRGIHGLATDVGPRVVDVLPDRAEESRSAPRLVPGQDHAAGKRPRLHQIQVHPAVHALSMPVPKIRRGTNALTATIAQIKKGDRVSAGFNHPRYAISASREPS